MTPVRRRAFVLVLLACFLVPSLGSTSSYRSSASEPHFAERDLLADPIWDDGRAEFTVYKGTISRYGEARALEARIIVVKEDMNLAQGVKSEAGPVAGKTRVVIKQNYSHDFQTGTYAYHQMCSAFLDRATGAMQKLVMSSTEGCGITFVELIPKSVPPAEPAPKGDTHPRPKPWTRISHSYWEDEGDRQEEIASISRDDPLLALDALPLWLRRLDLKSSQSFVIDLVPSQLGNRVRPLALVRSKIEVVGRADRHGLPVRVMGIRSDDGGRGFDQYWFDPAWPHPLVRFEGGNDPTVLERVKTTRLAYWKETARDDERLLRP